MSTSRTNIVIDDELLARVMRRHAVRTKREAVDLALRRLAGEPMSLAEARAMRGAQAIGEIPPDHGPRG